MALPHQHSIVQQDAATEEHPRTGRIQHRVTKVPPAGSQGQGVLQFYLSGRGHESLLLSAHVVHRLSFQTTDAFRVHEQNRDARAGFAKGTASSRAGAFQAGSGEGWEAESYLRIGRPLPPESGRG